MKKNGMNSLRLFHVSEEPDIRVFEPRLPTRRDLDPEIGLVWAIDEARLPNFLTPRDCPRVTYHVGEQTTEEDRKTFFTSAGSSHAAHCLRSAYGESLYVFRLLLKIRP